jgi:hypothetical protein
LKVIGPQATAPAICTSGGTTVGSAATVSGNGTYNPSAGFTPSQAGTYWWYAGYGGDGNNLESTSTCGSGMASTVVGSASPTVTAGAPTAALSGSAIAASSITSTLAAGASPTGTVSYKVFGPQASAPTTCTGGGTTVGTSSVSGNASYSSSASYTPSGAGVYWWYASYAGDPNNNSATSTCGSGMPFTYVYSASSVTTANATTGASATTSSFTVQPTTTYLLLVYRHSSTGDGLTSLSSASLSPALTLSSFTSITSQTYDISKDYQWAYWITTSATASGTGTLTLNFNNTLGGGSTTLVDLIQLGGVKTTAPVVTSNEITSNGNSGTATANLPSVPGSGDLGLVFLSAEKGLGGSAPTGSPGDDEPVLLAERHRQHCTLRGCPRGSERVVHVRRCLVGHDRARAHAPVARPGLGPTSEVSAWPRSRALPWTAAMDSTTAFISSLPDSSFSRWAGL